MKGKKGKNRNQHICESKTINPHAHKFIIKWLYRMCVCVCICEQINLVVGEKEDVFLHPSHPRSDHR